MCCFHRVIETRVEVNEELLCSVNMVMFFLLSIPQRYIMKLLNFEAGVFLPLFVVLLNIY